LIRIFWRPGSQRPVFSRLLHWIIGAASLVGAPAFLLGCAESTGVAVLEPYATPQPLAPGSSLLPSGNVDFTVSPSDMLQIEVYPRMGQLNRIDYGSQIIVEASFSGEDYTISPGDVLGIETNDDPSATKQVVVRPDGQITLAHLSKDIPAAGMTPARLARAISRAYSEIMNSPQTTVTVVRSGADSLEKIRGSYQVGNDGKITLPGLGAFKALGQTTASLAAQMEKVARARFHNPVSVSASLGQNSGRDVDLRIDPSGRFYFRGPVKVSPDGMAFVPPGGQVKVGGMSLTHARRAVLAALQPHYQNPIDVGVSLAESARMNVFVGGEVRQPGRYPYSKSMTLLKLITTSGWTTEVGDLTRVQLLHAVTPSHYLVYSTNLLEVLELGAVGQDLALSPQDIVIVPMTTIGSLDKMVDQYIRRMIPINAAATYSYINNPVANMATPAAAATGIK
jgi:protein involved in polysaccharide export with SLBB domain